MTELSLADSDVAIMLRVAQGSHAPDEVKPLPWQLLDDLRELIACDALFVVGQDTPNRTVFADQTLGEVQDEGPEEAYWAHYWDCLDCSYPDRTGDTSAVTMISDFYSEQAFHDTGMYVDYIGPSGIEREIRVCIPAGPGRTLRLMFVRGPGCDFTERDRALLTLLRPHLQTAYLMAERRRLGIAPLTARQEAVLHHVAAGYSNRQIARRLGVAESTVSKHLENVFARLGVTSRTAAAARLYQD